jgi:hypothetical protein
MAQRVRLQLNQGDVKNSRVFSAAAAKEMHASQTIIRFEPPYSLWYPEAAVALIPEEKLGLVVLSNLNGSALPVALMYRVFDSFLGGAPPRDWSAELLKTTKTLEEQAKAAEKKQESERATGTKPSVALTNNDTKSSFRFGPAFTSDLEHWHYDTFRARFFAAGDAKVFVTFPLNAQGKVETLVLGMPGMADYPFKRVAESKPEGGK